MTKLVLFNKPYRVLTQFSPQTGRLTLADFIDVKTVYPVGRLDYDSEGLLLLTNDGCLQQRMSHPRYKLRKTYWVQVENQPTQASLEWLTKGVLLNDGWTKPAQVQLIDEPSIWVRVPPIRYRAQIPTTWLELKIREGRNRQVRRMTAAVGHPTLRLIRYAIGTWTLDGLAPGQYRVIHVST